MAIGFFKAKELAKNKALIKSKKEIVNLQNAHKRVLATNIYAKRNLPSFNNSAMDGYAFRYKDINNALKVVATIYAGDTKFPILGINECYKIMTGAKVPIDANTIAPKEICECRDNIVLVKKNISKNNAIRFKGEEVKKEDLLLKKGQILTFDKIALLASQGISAIEVYKNIKIAILATGNELKEPWEDANEDEIYNINAINILMVLKEYGLEGSYLGKLPDNKEKLDSLIKSLKEWDVVITTGGVSVGDADFTKKVLLENGLDILFDGVRVKPGHPVMFGLIDKTFYIALPGNPLAAILNFLLLGLESIYKIQGATNFSLRWCKARMKKDLNLKPNRVNLVLGEFKDGYFSPYKDNKYGSGMIMPLVKSNAVAIFNEDILLVLKDQEIDIVLI